MTDNKKINKWCEISADEQETIINIDYKEKTISLYTSRKSIANRLKSVIGEPTKTHYTNKKISGVVYKRNIDDKETKKLLSKTILIGAMKSE